MVLQYYLYTSAFWGFSDLLTRILDSGADVNIQNADTGWTPLHAAVFQEHFKAIVALLGRGANVGLKDSDGRSALDLASASSRIWYLFEELGHKKTPRATLVVLKVVRDLPTDDGSAPQLPHQPKCAQRSARPGGAELTSQAGDKTPAE